MFWSERRWIELEGRTAEKKKKERTGPEALVTTKSRQNVWCDDFVDDSLNPWHMWLHVCVIAGDGTWLKTSGERCTTQQCTQGWMKVNGRCEVSNYSMLVLQRPNAHFKMFCLKSCPIYLSVIFTLMPEEWAQGEHLRTQGSAIARCSFSAAMYAHILQYHVWSCLFSLPHIMTNQQQLIHLPLLKLMRSVFTLVEKQQQIKVNTRWQCLCCSNRICQCDTLSKI